MLTDKAKTLSQLTLFEPPKIPTASKPKKRKRGRPKKQAPKIVYTLPNHIIERQNALDKLERDARLLVAYESNNTASVFVSYPQAKENFNRSWEKALAQGYSPADLFAIMRGVK